MIYSMVELSAGSGSCGFASRQDQDPHRFTSNLLSSIQSITVLSFKCGGPSSVRFKYGGTCFSSSLLFFFELRSAFGPQWLWVSSSSLSYGGRHFISSSYGGFVVISFCPTLCRQWVILFHPLVARHLHHLVLQPLHRLPLLQDRA